MVRAFIRLIVSLVGALLPIFFLSGSFSPFSSFLPNIPNLLGGQSALYTSLQNSIGTSLPVGILPVGTVGVTGVALYTVFQRVLGSVKVATYSRAKFDPSRMLNSLQSQMQNMNFQREMREIPQDMSKTQYLILSSYPQGQKNPKNIARMLSMDKKSVEEQTRLLQGSGYLTRNRKLTTKGLETVS